MRELIAVLLAMGLAGCPAGDDGGAGEWGGWDPPAFAQPEPPTAEQAMAPRVKAACSTHIDCVFGPVVNPSLTDIWDSKARCEVEHAGDWPDESDYQNNADRCAVYDGQQCEWAGCMLGEW